MKKVSMKFIRKVVYEFVSEGIKETEKNYLRNLLEACNEIHEIEHVMDAYGYDEPAATILELIVEEKK